MAIDFSDLGAQEVTPQPRGIDFSDLGGQRIDAPQAYDPRAHTALENAGQDIKGMWDMALGSAKKFVTLPAEAAKSGVQMAQGKSFGETPLAEDVRSGGSMALNAVPHLVTDPSAVGKYGAWDKGYRVAPGAVIQQYADIATSPLKAVPEQYMPDAILTPEEQKALPNPFQEHPVNTALALLPLASPALKAARSIPAVDSAMNTVSEALKPVAQGLARRSLGFSKSFLDKTKWQLPSANRAAQTALDTGVIQNPLTHPFSSGPESMFQRASDLEEASGKALGAYTKSQNLPFNASQALQDLEPLKARFFNDPAAIRKIEAAKNLIMKNANLSAEQPPVPTMSFDDATKFKGYLQKKVNYNTDAATQDVGKAVAGTFRGSIDNQLQQIAEKGGAGPEFQQFLKNKQIFADANQMQKALLKKRAAETGNMLESLPSIGIGAAELIRGGALKGVLAGLGAEWVKRFGSAAGATMTNNVAKLFMSNPAKYQALLQPVTSAGVASIPAIEAALRNEPEFQQIIQKPSKPPKSVFNKNAA